MGLKKRIKNIAQQEAAKMAQAILASLNSQVNQTGSPYVATVVRANSPNEFVILDNLGNEKTVTYIGNRPVGADGTVLISGDFAQ